MRVDQNLAEAVEVYATVSGAAAFLIIVGGPSFAKCIHTVTRCRSYRVQMPVWLSLMTQAQLGLVVAAVAACASYFGSGGTSVLARASNLQIVKLIA